MCRLEDERDNLIKQLQSRPQECYTRTYQMLLKEQDQPKTHQLKKHKPNTQEKRRGWFRDHCNLSKKNAVDKARKVDDGVDYSHLDKLDMETLRKAALATMKKVERESERGV